jgi:molybdopterin converting factor small subunit
LEILAGLSERIDTGNAGGILWEEETDEGETVGDVIKRMALRHRGLGEAVFDAGTDRISGHVAIVLNDRLLESLNGLDTPVGSEDVIKMFPVIAGG